MNANELAEIRERTELTPSEFLEEAEALQGSFSKEIELTEKVLGQLGASIALFQEAIDRWKGQG